MRWQAVAQFQFKNGGVEGICELENTKCKGETEHGGNSVLYFTRPAMIII